jgi:DNA topoisomerase-1
MNTTKETEQPQITKRVIKKIGNDPEKAAKAVDLVYVSDADPGIKRIKTDSGFDYILNNRKLKNKEHLTRIKSLVIPPAWEDVWICVLPNGHLQVTGFDAKKTIPLSSCME